MRNLSPALGATTLIGAITSVLLWQQLSAAREVARNLQDQLTVLEAGPMRPLHATTIVQESKGLQGMQAPEVRVGNQLISAGQSASGDAANRGRTNAVSSAELLRDPAMRQSMATSIRATLPQRYPYLAEELNLTAEQLGRLFDQLTENQLELLASPLPGTDTDAGRQAAGVREELSRRHDAGLASTLGATTYNQWKDYQETAGLRQQLGQLGTALESTAQPLTDVQRRQMTAALVDYQKQLNLEIRQTTGSTDPDSGIDRTGIAEARLRKEEEHHQRLRDVAASYLSPEQLDVFARIQSQEATLVRALMRAQPGQQDRLN